MNNMLRKQKAAQKQPMVPKKTYIRSVGANIDKDNILPIGSNRRGEATSTLTVNELLAGFAMNAPESDSED